MFAGRNERSHRAHIILAAFLAASLLTVFTASGASAGKRRKPTPSAPSASPILVPASGTLFGAYVDKTGYWVDNQTAENGVTTFERQIGRTIAIDQHYYAWTDTFPSGLEQWDLAGGRIPLISWQGTTLSDITSGSYDAMIRARADGLKALGQKVFLRWGWEMNGNWYAWDGTHNSDGGLTNGPQKYVAAWRHIHDLFVARGATNVVWVWCPNADNVPSSTWNSWRNYYPGDAYVDWVGIDGYNWGTSQSWSSWRSFSSLMSGVYNDYAASKPVMIAEVASAEVGGSKPDWIAATSSTIKGSFPAIKAFVWFDANKETDWRADSSSATLAAYTSMGSDSYFKPSGF